jgi:hypothetical protein
VRLADISAEPGILIESLANTEYRDSLRLRVVTQQTRTAVTVTVTVILANELARH